ncbi:hypothetical protein TTHERM_000670189 (macronuclear) [Tetrahymena thermophila SB210]|uniref:Uncharacterized protein n=1 Tax=Tetrahymena thermophila (strain SB210) TaxID=312017 RepID=W7XF14_TETTS|nr:hypothetical protein TTHERM_000670189 [Tetrahymena thermophila SB210]EWS71344.1 hypothetical protein TTHERM_000670189 [Tetrahymena thermophila SB210]|eukprot:XP_012656118.1 hypothetical protein TTHERM_000670189 [Tetrahymena thermophila SB210]
MLVNYIKIQQKNQKLNLYQIQRRKQESNISLLYFLQFLLIVKKILYALQQQVMTSRNTTSSEQRFRRAKFIFDDLEKFIVMDVFLKVALDDLKFSFSKILNLDFFGKRFIYQFQITPTSGNQTDKVEIDLDASKLLEEQDCIKKFIEDSQNQNKEMQFKVKFEDIGA